MSWIISQISEEAIAAVNFGIRSNESHSYNRSAQGQEAEETNVEPVPDPLRDFLL